VRRCEKIGAQCLGPQSWGPVMKMKKLLNPQVAKNNIETRRGCWKSLAAAPLEVGYMRF